MTGPPDVRLHHGKEAFASTYGRPEPDLIVFSSCLWDLYAVGEQGSDLREDYLVEYGANLSNLLRDIAVSSPEPSSHDWVPQITTTSLRLCGVLRALDQFMNCADASPAHSGYGYGCCHRNMPH